MPSQAELIATLKAISEQVVESLKMLLMLLMNLTEIHATPQQVPEEQSTQLNRLFQEVRLQRTRIEEISTILRAQYSIPGSPPRMINRGEELIDSEQEWDTVSVAPTVRSQAPTRRAPSVVSAAPTTPVPQPARNAPPPTSQAASSVRALPPNLQLVEVATTTTRLDAWGEKEVTWGRKHKGSQYQHAFLDQSYVKWVAERENTLTPEMLDFHRYCQTRLHVAANI